MSDPTRLVVLVALTEDEHRALIDHLDEEMGADAWLSTASRLTPALERLRKPLTVKMEEGDDIESMLGTVADWFERHGIESS